MKHLRGDLIALLAVLALALAGQREATAGPCKADGETCRRSRSCCGTSGNNGLCVKAPGARFGTCSTVCTPRECTPADCSVTPDGCGHFLNCPCNRCSAICADGSRATLTCSSPLGCSENCPDECAAFCATVAASECATAFCVMGCD